MNCCKIPKIISISRTETIIHEIYKVLKYHEKTSSKIEQVDGVIDNQDTNMM